LTKKPPKINSDDLFSMDNGADGSADTVSAGVVSAAKEALSRMPVVDIKILQQRLSRDAFGSDGTGDIISRPPKTSLPSMSSQNGAASGAGDLLDIFGGGDGIASTSGPTQNGAVAANPNGGKSDLDLLSDIFSVQPSTAEAPATTGIYDPFSAPVLSSQGSAPASIVNPLDLFGAPPPTSSIQTGSMSTSNDLFGISQPAHQKSVSQPAAMDLFGSAPIVTTPTLSAGGIRVPALSHGGLIVEFECTKPESLNLQKSVLLAHFRNTTNAPINGMNLQVAVPKFVKMELEPPTSTTIPPSNAVNSKTVSQKVTVTNSMLETKNLVLKLKISFTSNGQTIEHMATCSGFPAGQY
jgi:AP-1 complex subunit gamma-1